MNGSAIARRFTELSFQQPQSATFKNGVDNGSIVTLAIFGKTDPQDREIVEAAEIEAARIGIPLPTYLMMSLFFEPVKERFGLD
ncbi:hypothetical protein [Pseudovibrio denitrificans]|nr:hypothetical protein [Pseudovibrio denitrificans]